MSLIHRILLVTALITLFSAAVLITAGNYARYRVESRLADPVNAGIRFSWEVARDAQMALMAERTADVAMDFAIKQALKEGDDQALHQAAATFFDLVAEQGVFDQLVVTDPAGRVRFAYPEPYPTSLEHPVLAAAARSLEVATATSTAPDGRLALHAAVPIKSRSKLYGLAVYVTYLDRVVRRFVAEHGGDLAVLAGDGRAHAASRPELFAAIDWAPFLVGPGDLRTIAQGDRFLRAAVQPLAPAEEAASTPRAYLAALRDVTDQQTEDRRVDRLILAVMALGVAGSLGAFWAYIRRALRPLKHMVAQLSAVAAGQLTTVDRDSRGDEIGQLHRALADAVDQLRDVVGRVGETSGELVSHAGDLHRLAGESLDGMRQELGRIAQIDEATHQLTDTTEHLAGNTAAIAASAQQTMDEATQGARLVRESVDQVQAISTEMGGLSHQVSALQQHSRNIDEIVGVISSIADQTNLLALNAAIESARAGEHGRGFAVVADQVRHLATQTAHSTGEISRVVAAIQQEIAAVSRAMGENSERMVAGSALSVRAGESLTHILERFSDLQRNIEEVASATEELSATSREISVSVKDMRGVTDHVTACAQQVSDASDSLTDLAGNLQSRVDYFRV